MLPTVCQSHNFCPAIYAGLDLKSLFFVHLFFTFLDKFNGSVPLKIRLQNVYTLGRFHVALVAPEKIVSFSALNRERTASMFMVLHFNVPGERATLQNGCHASFKKYKNMWAF